MAMCKKVTTSQVAMCKKVTASHGNVLKNCKFASKRVHFMITPMGVIIIWKQCHGNVMGMAPKNAQELSPHLVLQFVIIYALRPVGPFGMWQ